MASLVAVCSDLPIYRTGLWLWSDTQLKSFKKILSSKPTTNMYIDKILSFPCAIPSVFFLSTYMIETTQHKLGHQKSEQSITVRKCYQLWHMGNQRNTYSQTCTLFCLFFWYIWIWGLMVWGISSKNKWFLTLKHLRRNLQCS